MAKFDFQQYPSIQINLNTERPDKVSYNLNGVKYESEEDLPKIDIFSWAKEMGLKISDDGKTLTCYKTVRKRVFLDGIEVEGYFSFFDPNFRYFPGIFVSADKLDPCSTHECSHGLYGTSVGNALEYSSGYYDDQAILELAVDISDPDNYVIPYAVPEYFDFNEGVTHVLKIRPSKKLRFKTCYVVREVKVKEAYIDEATGEIYT